MSPVTPHGAWPNDWAENLCVESGSEGGDPVLLFSGLGISAYPLRTLALACQHLPLRLRLRSLPGHNGDGEAFRKITITQMMKEGEAALESMARSGQPVLLGGFSGGAVLSMCLAARRPELVRALFLIGYCPRLKSARHRLIVTGCGLLDHIVGVRTLLRKKSFRVKESGAADVMDPRYREQPRFGGFAAGAFAVLWKMQLEAREVCRRVQKPVHFFHGRCDDRADLEDVLAIHKVFQARGAPAPRVYEKSPHCVLLGPEAEQLQEDFADAVGTYL